jgi:hypothetical protein
MFINSYSKLYASITILQTAMIPLINGYKI